MGSKFGTRYSVVASTLALVVALSGVAYAANTIGSGDVIDDSLLSRDIRNNTLKTEDVRNGSLLRGDFAAGQVSPRLFAVVDGDGSLLASAGVTNSVRNTIGDYSLTFNRIVTACAWLATPGARNGATSSVNNRVITVNDESSNIIHVATGLGGTPVDMTFNLAVIC